MGRARIILPSFRSFDSDQKFALCALSLATTAGDLDQQGINSRPPLPAAECRFREAHNAPAEILQKQQFSPAPLELFLRFYLSLR